VRWRKGLRSKTIGDFNMGRTLSIDLQFLFFWQGVRFRVKVRVRVRIRFRV
jgi:hypothetical protein